MKKYVFKPYSKIFPILFQKEKERITPHLKQVLAIEHVGSTAVPGLGGKGIIDIAIAVDRASLDSTTHQLQSLGYEYRPKFSTPDRFYFVTYLPDPEEETRRYHIHLTYPESNTWKELIAFRDYLRLHPAALQEYAELKKQAALVANEDGERYRQLKAPILEKIRKSIMNKELAQIHLVKCSSNEEWEFARKLRLKYFFDPLGIKDPYTWTFDHKEHVHFILYQGEKMVGYAHLQLWPHLRAALRIIVIDENYQNHGLGSQFLHLCEQWAKNQGIKSLHDEARPTAIKFYRKNGYTEMPFNDPSGEPPSPHDLAMGKIL